MLLRRVRGRVGAYPRVLSEHETLELAHAGVSIGRYGDGEFNHCFGKSNATQPADFNLTRELRELLLSDDSRFLPCIPNVYSATPKNWLEYAGRDVCGLLRNRVYGSAFISRPDSAPWIDTPEYWDRVTDLWRGKDVVLAIGSRRSLVPALLQQASSVRLVEYPSGSRGTGAYDKIDQIEEEVGRPSGPALLCLGPTGTVLAARLARKGVHGLDLGHIGMFLRAAGAYSIPLYDLASREHRRLLERIHARREAWASSGYEHAEAVAEFALRLKAETVLDYGCGSGTLGSALASGVPPRKVAAYDPGVPDRAALPEPSDLIVCTHVLEHVEPSKLEAVMAHIHRLSLKAAYFVVAIRPENTTVREVGNGPLIDNDAAWWLQKIARYSWKHVRLPHIVAGGSLTTWLVK